MQYLVTGGAGFIGSHLVEALLHEGHAVRVLDDISTGSRTNLNPDAEFIAGDIRDFDAIAPAFVGCDGVFHVAAFPNVQFSVEHPIESHAVNTTGTLHVLEAARRASIKRVVFMSSSAVYGDQPTLPFCEEMTPMPKSPYGAQKLMSEEYCRLYERCYGLETACLRCANVYGPRMSDIGAYVTVIAVFLRQRRLGEPLTVTGDGEQTRDFVHVRDVARANILAMASANVGRGETMNIGSGERHSVNEIARLIGGPVVHLPARIEPRDTLMDAARARELLGWAPEVKFEEGVRELSFAL